MISKMLLVSIVLQPSVLLSVPLVLPCYPEVVLEPFDFSTLVVEKIVDGLCGDDSVRKSVDLFREIEYALLLYG